MTRTILIAIAAAAAAHAAGLRVEPSGEPGKYTGVTVSRAGLSRTISFSSSASAWAAKLRRKAGALRFTDLASSAGAKFASDSFVEFKQGVLQFRVHVSQFDEAKWRQTMGAFPFHMLCFESPGAAIFHIGGWHIPTPALDPYPLHNDGIGYARQITSRWSRDWTYAPAVAALPMPAAGLWSPRLGHYFGFCAAGPADMGIAGVWDKARPRLAIVYPPARPPQTLTMPKAGEPFTVEGKLRLLLRADIGSDDTPNRLMHGLAMGLLGPAPNRTAGVSWIPRALRPKRRLPNFALRRVTTAPHLRPGALVFVEANEPNPDDVETLLRLAQRKTLDRDACCFWRYPLAGDYVAMYGRGAATTHSDASWKAGLMLLSSKRRDRDALAALDGIVRFTKHMAYTRGSRPDAPAAPSVRAATAGIAFCLQYHAAFKADPERRDLAGLALKLARSIAYRALTVWPVDDRPGDKIDSSFVAQTNAGASWVGTVAGAAMWPLIADIADAAIATSDGTLAYYAHHMARHAAPFLTRDGKVARVGVMDGAGVPRGTWRGEDSFGVASLSVLFGNPQLAPPASTRVDDVLEPPRGIALPFSRLKPQMERFSGQIAVLPNPSQANPIASRVGNKLKAAGLVQHLHGLTPQQFVNPSYFNAKSFPIAMYLASERYYQTVRKPGDGDAALKRYLRDGGLLLVLPTGTFPFYQNEKGKTIMNSPAFGFSISGVGSGPIGLHAQGARLGGFERPPKGVTLTLHRRAGQRVIPSAPAARPYPTGVDPRWRPTVHKVTWPCRYTPLITLRDQTGRSWGEAAALIEFTDCPGRIVSVWFSLLAVPELGDAVLEDVLRYAMATATPGPPRRRAEPKPLPFSDDFSQAHGEPGPTWTRLDGNWRVERDALVGQECLRPGLLAMGLMAGGPAWTDYEVRLRFKVERLAGDWKDGPWIGLRCNRDGDGYHLLFTTRGAMLVKSSHGVTDSERRPMARAAAPIGSAWRVLRVRLQANRIDAWLDGQPLLSAEDHMRHDLPSIRGGGISLCARRWSRAPGRTVVRFDDVQVRAISE